MRRSARRWCFAGVVAAVVGCSSAVEYVHIGAVPEPQYSTRHVKKIQARGKYLLQVAHCGYCHGAIGEHAANAPLSGGRLVSVEDGDVRAANITSDMATGIGSWSTDEIATAIASAVGKENVQLDSTVHRAYRWMASEDREAIAFALKRTTPVSNTVQRQYLGSDEKPKTGYVAQVQPSNDAAYGRYIVHYLSACVSCHSAEDPASVRFSPFAGKKLPKGEGISLSGPEVNFRTGGWSTKTIETYLKTGKTPSGSTAIDCPQQFFGALEQRDRLAVARYLHTR